MIPWKPHHSWKLVCEYHWKIPLLILYWHCSINTTSTIIILNRFPIGKIHMHDIGNGSIVYIFNIIKKMTFLVLNTSSWRFDNLTWIMFCNTDTTNSYILMSWLQHRPFTVSYWIKWNRNYRRKMEHVVFYFAIFFSHLCHFCRIGENTQHICSLSENWWYLII